MSFPVDDKDRHIIPRWRDSSTTAALGELDSSGSAAEPQEPATALIAEKVAEWVQHKSLSYASDLLATAMSVGASVPEGTEAAQFLIRSADASPAAISIARRYLGHSEPAIDLLERYSATTLSSADRHKRIHALRSHLRESPRNVLRRVDLALEYTALGEIQQALTAMELAIRLAPESRFLLRSASRLLVHIGDTDGALALLRESGVSQHDPWLAAAEIAVAGLAETESRLAKRGSQLLKSDRRADEERILRCITNDDGPSGAPDACSASRIKTSGYQSFISPRSSRRRGDCASLASTAVTTMSNRERTITELFDDGTAIDNALLEAARDARRFHKAIGNPMATWRDGKVVWVQPEDIVVDLPENREP